MWLVSAELSAETDITAYPNAPLGYTLVSSNSNANWTNRTSLETGPFSISPTAYPRNPTALGAWFFGGPTYHPTTTTTHYQANLSWVFLIFFQPILTFHLHQNGLSLVGTALFYFIYSLRVPFFSFSFQMILCSSITNIFLKHKSVVSLCWLTLSWCITSLNSTLLKWCKGSWRCIMANLCSHTPPLTPPPAKLLNLVNLELP